MPSRCPSGVREARTWGCAAPVVREKRRQVDPGGERRSSGHLRNRGGTSREAPLRKKTLRVDVSGAGLLLRGPPLSPGVVRGVGTTSRDTLPRAPLSVGASAAEWEILDGKRVDLQSGAP